MPTASIDHAIVIAGAGPTGLMLAGELALAKVDVAIVERRATQDVDGSRALGMQSRIIELLDQRGIAGRFLAAGFTAQTQYFGATRLDISDFPTRHNYGLALRQQHTERLLAEWVAELRVPIYRPCDVADFTDDAHGVTIALSDARQLRAQYLVGCDGGRSTIRRLTGIDFPGSDATTSWMIAEVETTEEPRLGFFTDASGRIQAIGRDEHGRTNVVLMEPDAPAGEPSVDDLRALLRSVYGTDFGVHGVTRLSRFNDATRQAAHYRKGRVLLAGDAANIRAPLGGQGLGLGIQDAVNLGWKLARVANGISPEALLDTYHDERHPATARVLQAVLAQVATRRVEPPTAALTQFAAEFLTFDGPRRAMAGLMSGLDVHYALGGSHPLVGRRMPDLDVAIGGAPTRVFALLHGAHAVLLDFAGTIAGNVGNADVDVVRAECNGPWELPVIGEVAPPTAVLVRPDGHVAWVGEGGAHAGLRDALAYWFAIRPS